MAVSVQESCTVLWGATTISVFLDENSLFKQFCESLVSSPHAITHTATQALRPRTGASSFWGDWRGKFWTHGVTSAVPKTHPHCQMRTRLQWHAKAEEIWSHAHQCKQCKYQAVSATVITEAAMLFCFKEKWIKACVKMKNPPSNNSSSHQLSLRKHRPATLHPDYWE